ncbi:PaaI family thioesterase [Betaproteobacteria bacterium PRO7]|jgi:uncharacterized protein (TIGR00369 family)|nr:PaaI family thioesterase [Betaproteobacteria bacterium PRO7]
MRTELDEVPFVRALGAKLVNAASGEAVLSLDLQERHLNSWAVAHGGTLMALLDVAIARAGKTVSRGAAGSVTVEMKTSFLRPCVGRISARARVLHSTGSLAFCEAELLDQSGELAAKASATIKFLPDRKLAERPPAADAAK